MLIVVRIALALAGLVAGWFVSYWIYFARFDVEDAAFMARGMPFLIGLAVAAVIVAGTEHLTHGFLASTVLGALLLGSIGFVAGFFGPMIIDPGGNQGPLLGLLMTGPGGFVLGAPLGALWWWIRRRRTLA